MIKTLKGAFALILALILCLSAFASCDNGEDSTETGSGSESGSEAEAVEFDYEAADLSRYITLSADTYKSNKVTLSEKYIVTDEMVQEYIDDERFKNKVKANSDTQVTDQPIKLGDSAFIYYTGYLDGVAFDGGSNASDKNSYELSIGSGSFIPGFEEGLIGLVPNTTSKEKPFDLKLTFPEDYHSADLAGKSVVFKVWVEYVIQYTIPDFTDDYVSNTLKFNGSAEEYRAEVKKGLQDSATSEAENEAVAAILNKLVSSATIHEYPEQSVNYWYEAYVGQFEYYMSYYSMYGYSFDGLDDFVPQYLGLKDGEDWKTVTVGYAKEMVESSLVYYTVARQQGLSVSDEEFAAEVKELAEYYSSESKTYTADDIIEQIGEQSIRQGIIFEKVEELWLKNCTIEYSDKE